MPLSARPVITKQFEQATPATTWTIVHQLSDYPVVDVYITSDGGVKKVLPKAINYVDANTISIEFSVARTGYITVAA